MGRTSVLAGGWHQREAPVIKFAGSNTASGLPVLGIGLSREDCDRLLEGQSILFSTQTMLGLPPLEVFIMGGESEPSMVEAFVAAGAIDNCPIIEDKGLADPFVGPDKGEVN